MSSEFRIDADRLASSLKGLEQRVEGDQLLPMLHTVLSACDELFSLSGCGLLTEDAEVGLQFAAATSASSRELEKAQIEAGQGPCLDAFIEARVVETADLWVDDRWPDLTLVVKDLGVRAVLGCPVFIDGISIGSLDVYLDAPHEWDESERRAIARFASVVGSALTAALQVQHMSTLTDQLKQALASRIDIERAVGYLMARRNIPAIEAFESLRSAARSRQRKVRQLALDVLRGMPLDPD